MLNIVTPSKQARQGKSDCDPSLFDCLDSICLIPDQCSIQEQYTYSLSIYQDLKQASDCDKKYVVSDASSTSSGSRKRFYCLQTRKEKQKKRHGLKGKQVKWLDLSQTDEINKKLSNFPMHLAPCQTFNFKT